MPAPAAWWARSATSAPVDSSTGNAARCSSARRKAGTASSTARRVSSCRKRKTFAVRDEGPGQQALVDHRSRQAADLSQGLGAGRLHQHGCRLEELLRVLGDAEHARRNDIGHGARDGVRLAGERLHDVEGVAAGELEEALGIAGVALGQQPDRLGAQGRQGQPARGPVGDQMGQRLTVWCVSAGLPLAEGDHDQRPRALDAPRQEAEPVECRLVGPVQVLDDDARGRRGRLQVGQEGSEQPVPVVVVARGLGQAAVELVDDLAERAQGRGVKLPSQAPQSQRKSGRDSRKASTSDVFPIPGSPETTTKRPWPESASAA